MDEQMVTLIERLSALVDSLEKRVQALEERDDTTMDFHKDNNDV